MFNRSSGNRSTIKTGVYNKFFDKDFKLVFPNKIIQKNSVNKSIRFVKMEMSKPLVKL